MAKYASVVLIFVTFTFVSFAGDHRTHKGGSQGWTAPLLQLGFDGSLERLPEPRNSQTKQVSSYDRAGGNKDDEGGHQVYEGGAVLADLHGPGVITRIWTRNPHGTIYIYIDDIEHPILSLPFRECFTCGLEHCIPGSSLFPPPFVGEGTGGCLCNVS